MKYEYIIKNMCSSKILCKLIIWQKMEKNSHIYKAMFNKKFWDFIVRKSVMFKNIYNFNFNENWNWNLKICNLQLVFNYYDIM